MKGNITEQKAKAYDDAIKEASIAYKEGDAHIKATLERIFPHIGESEDEKICRELIDFVESHLAGFSNCERFTDYLKRQGDKDKLIQELGEYKVKYIQEVLEKQLNWEQELTNIVEPNRCSKR